MGIGLVVSNLTCSQGGLQAQAFVRSILIYKRCNKFRWRRRGPQAMSVLGVTSPPTPRVELPQELSSEGQLYGPPLREQGRKFIVVITATLNLHWCPTSSGLHGSYLPSWPLAVLCCPNYPPKKRMGSFFPSLL